MTDTPALLTPHEAAALFRVDIKTLGRWAKLGRIPYLITPGGHYRYPADDVYRLLEITTTRKT